MDKQWRNLGILVVIVVVAVAVYFSLPYLQIVEPPAGGGPDVPDEVDLREEMFSEILAVFENNDVNIEVIRNLDNIYFAGEQAYFREDESSLLSTKEELNSLKQSIASDYNSGLVSEGDSLIDIYSEAIDFLIFENETIEQMKSIQNLTDSNSCENMNLVVETADLVNQRFDKLWELFDLVQEHMFNFDLLSEAIIIDYESEELAEISFNNDIEVFMDYCQGDLNE